MEIGLVDNYFKRSKVINRMRQTVQHVISETVFQFNAHVLQTTINLVTLMETRAYVSRPTQFFSL